MTSARVRFCESAQWGTVHTAFRERIGFLVSEGRHCFPESCAAGERKEGGSVKEERMFHRHSSVLMEKNFSLL